jgi:HD-like signal output (HDOD) protein
MVEKKRIGEMLVWEGLVTTDQVNEALEVQKQHGGKLVGILINLGYLDETTFLEFLAQHSRVPNINIANYEIRRDIVALVPAELARKHELLPIDKLGRLLTVAMVCPLDQATLDELSQTTGLKIKPVLCSAADVRDGINRYYAQPTVAPTAQPETAPEEAQTAPSSGTFRLTGVPDIVRRIDALPTLPAILARVRGVMEDPQSSATDIARVISGDPAIASKVLQVANSAAYGFPRKIADIAQAIAWLGLKETYQIALSVRALDMFAKDKRFDYERFRSHSAQCAAAANVLAKRCGLQGKTGIFAAGLLHDIGKLVLVDALLERYAKIAARIAEEGHESVLVEEDELGVSHAEVGYLLAEHWQFPLEMGEAIRFHHKPDLAEQDKAFTGVIALANRVAHDAATGQDASAIASTYPELLSLLGLTADAAVEALEEYLDKSGEVEVL